MIKWLLHITFVKLGKQLFFHEQFSLFIDI